MPDFTAARNSLAVFAEMVGEPMAEFQAQALESLETRTTCIVAPRQSGKSRSLALLANHRAFRTPKLRVLIVSAGEGASRRLLAEVRRMATGSPLLRGSVVDETAGLVRLTNGSEIRSVPASERQIRGWTVDLLLIDEAALVADDLISGAAIPTTAARPGARIVMASSATAASGSFYDHVMLGMQGSEHVRTFNWALTECPWIAASTIAAARESMSPARFSAEYEGKFASGADALFPRALLDRQTADYLLPGLHGLGASAGLAGVDWGATTDRTALVAVGALAHPAGVFAITAAHAWRSGEALDGPGGIIGQIAELPARFEQVSAETNGLGFPLAKALERRLRERPDHCPRIAFVQTTQDSKSATYSSLRMLLEQGRLVLPASAPELLRELLLLRVQVTQSGGERIEAGVGHDDLADALYIAAGPYQAKNTSEWKSQLANAAEQRPIEPSEDEGTAELEMVTTGAGLLIPREPLTGRVGGAARRNLGTFSMDAPTPKPWRQIAGHDGARSGAAAPPATPRRIRHF